MQLYWPSRRNCRDRYAYGSDQGHWTHLPPTFDTPPLVQPFSHLGKWSNLKMTRESHTAFPARSYYHRTTFSLLTTFSLFDFWAQLYLNSFRSFFLNYHLTFLMLYISICYFIRKANWCSVRNTWFWVECCNQIIPDKNTKSCTALKKM